jgi:hypothetical protein
VPVAAARGRQSVRSCRATRGGHRTGRGAAIFTCLWELPCGALCVFFLAFGSFLIFSLFRSPNSVHSYTHDTPRLYTRMVVLYIRGVCVCVCTDALRSAAAPLCSPRSAIHSRVATATPCFRSAPSLPLSLGRPVAIHPICAAASCVSSSVSYVSRPQHRASDCARRTGASAGVPVRGVPVRFIHAQAALRDDRSGTPMHRRAC